MAYCDPHHPHVSSAIAALPAGFRDRTAGSAQTSMQSTKKSTEGRIAGSCAPAGGAFALKSMSGVFASSAGMPRFLSSRANSDSKESPGPLPPAGQRASEKPKSVGCQQRTACCLDCMCYDLAAGSYESVSRNWQKAWSPKVLNAPVSRPFSAKATTWRLIGTRMLQRRLSRSVALVGIRADVRWVVRMDIILPAVRADGRSTGANERRAAKRENTTGTNAKNCRPAGIYCIE